jgi:allantoate deiminase
LYRSLCRNWLSARLRHWKNMSELKAAATTPANQSLGEAIVGRIGQLGALSETPEHLARIFLTPEHRAAADLILGWMRSAGMAAHLDAIGTSAAAMKASGRDCPA